MELKDWKELVDHIFYQIANYEFDLFPAGEEHIKGNIIEYIFDTLIHRSKEIIK